MPETTQKDSTATETTQNALKKSVTNLQSLGRNWATTALTTSADSLTKTADFLNGLSAKLNNPPETRKAGNGEKSKA